MKVQTRKLKSPAKKPMRVPAPVPSRIAATMTGSMAKVATIGPMGRLPSRREAEYRLNREQHGELNEKQDLFAARVCS